MAETVSKRTVDVNADPYIPEMNLDFTYQIIFPEQQQLPAHTGEKESSISLDESSANTIHECYFDNSLKKADRWDYLIASGSALLCSALDILWVGNVNLLELRDFGREKAEAFVIAMAKRNGYKGNDLKDAIRVLEEKFRIPSDEAKNQFGGAKQHHLRDFAHHASPMGLCFSLLTQFTGKAYGTDTLGVFKIVDVSESIYIGKNTEEKLFFGTVIWAGHLISDMAGSSNQNAGWGVGIPGPILSFLKELSALPIFRKEDPASFSVFVSKLYNGTFFEHDTKENVIRFDLREEIGIFHQMAKQAVPVLANECIVRAAYFLRRIGLIIKENEIRTFRDFRAVAPDQYLPKNSRELTRMLTVSLSVFMLITTTETLVYSLSQSEGDAKKAAALFLVNMNWPGAARLVFAVRADAKYISEDMAEAIKKFRENLKDRSVISNAPGLEQFILNESQTRILHSLLRQKIEYDVEKTKSKDKADKKEKWLEAWETANGIDRLALMTEEADIQKTIEEELQTSVDSKWLYLIASELILFRAYAPLGVENDKDFKKLRLKTDFEKDRFCSYQQRISEKKIADIKKVYDQACNILDEKGAKVAAGAAVVIGLTAATGGIAYVFAPEIAVLIAGDAVAGLSGAALTSASLAYVGLGSLAAGGLGMAGGAAIIAGGGSLLGVLSSGITMVSLLALSSSNAVFESCARLMTVCKAILLDVYEDEEMVGTILHEIRQGKKEAEDTLKNLEKQRKSKDKKESNIDKKVIRDTRKSLDYITRCENYLNKQIS